MKDREVRLFFFKWLLYECLKGFAREDNLQLQIPKSQLNRFPIFTPKYEIPAPAFIPVFVALWPDSYHP